MSVPLTPEICAQAIVAACRIYQTAPLRAFEAQRGPGRSALMAAASAAQKITCSQRETAARIFNVHPVSLARCEREAKPLFLRAVAAAWEAIKIEDTDHSRPQERGTVVAPPPAAKKPLAPAVDHRPAIAEAMARRRAKAAERGFEVVGVESDQALIGTGGCCWPPKGVTYAMDDPVCHETAVQGRLFCPEHCRALGQKDTPVVLAPADMPQRFAERKGAH